MAASNSMSLSEPKLGSGLQGLMKRGDDIHHVLVAAVLVVFAGRRGRINRTSAKGRDGREEAEQDRRSASHLSLPCEGADQMEWAGLSQHRVDHLWNAIRDAQNEAAESSWQLAELPIVEGQKS
jgi:hypothetical protein